MNKVYPWSITQILIHTQNSGRSQAQSGHLIGV